MQPVYSESNGYHTKDIDPERAKIMLQKLWVDFGIMVYEYRWELSRKLCHSRGSRPTDHHGTLTQIVLKGLWGIQATTHFWARSDGKVQNDRGYTKSTCESVWYKKCSSRGPFFTYQENIPRIAALTLIFLMKIWNRWNLILNTKKLPARVEEPLFFKVSNKFSLQNCFQ